MNSNKIAIIGGGPAGITMLKCALEDGLDAVLFEQSDNIGGQWNNLGDHSGVWESLHTNSSKYVTAFSDFPQREDVQLYPGYGEVKQYIDDYSRHFGLAPFIELETNVQKVCKLQDGNYSVTYSAREKQDKTEIFSHVVVATGRFNKPHIPAMPGLGNFKGSCIHAKNYKTSTSFKGQRVLVIGDRVSGLEIASDLSFDESIAVITSSRKPKYIVTKTINGLPGDHFLFTRFRSFAAQAFPPEVNGKNFKEFVLQSCGNPADFGGLKPSENIFEAGISVCQHYLQQVKKNRILTKGSIRGFSSTGVVFDDGTKIGLDAVILATGYELSLPFLNDDIFNTINSGERHLDLFKYTFHPDLPNMAFIGLYMQIGSKFPSFELQARWIAGCWSGNMHLPGGTEMQSWINAFKLLPVRDGNMSQEMIIMFAKAAGVEPDLAAYPELAGSLIFGPLLPAQFRLQGHGKNPGAMAAYLGANLGKVHTLADLPPQQLLQLKAVAEILTNNIQLQKLMETVNASLTE